jgi:hypothetical protein
MNQYQSLDDIVYLTVKGSSGTTVDIDHLNANPIAGGSKLTPPVFKSGNSDLNIFAYVGAPISADLSATDAGSTDVATYDASDSIPQGAVLNSSNGAFSWQPMQTGTYSFTVAASDGTTSTGRNVNITVTGDRAFAVQAAIATYNPNSAYVSTTLNNYNAAYSDTMSQINTASDAAFCQQLQTLRSAVEGLKLLTPLLKDGSIDYPKVILKSTFGANLLKLLDGDTSSGSSYGQAADLYHIVDFGPDYKVSATAFGFQSNIFADRLAGSAVFGSNDGDNWTKLTPGLTAFTQSFQTLRVDDALKNSQFRFIKIQLLTPQPDVLHNTVQNLFEISEFRIYGQVHETGNKLASVSIGSDQALMNRIVVGNTAKITIVAKEAIQNVKVKIQGVDATVSTQDNINWTAVTTLNQGVATGSVKFAIDYQTNDGKNGDTAYFTTDDSKLFLADESDLIQNVPGITNLIDPSTSIGRPSATVTLQQVNYLFDGKANTNSDFRVGGNGAGGYITFDFKAENRVVLSQVEVLARQDQYYYRISGAVVQGSNDNTTWDTISPKAVSIRDWQVLSINSTKPYRYIRMYNSSAWFGNMAELRFHGIVKPADLTPPVTTDDAPQGWVNQDTKVSFNATDVGYGVAATYFTADGGEKQTGNEVTLNTEGKHKITYWSVDLADNVEQPHTVTVNIDKTAPETLAENTPSQSDGVNGWYVHPVTVSLSANDNLSGVASTVYRVGESGDWVTYTQPLIFRDEGIFKLQYCSVDNAGNPEATKEVTIRNDFTAPEAAISANDKELKDGDVFEDYQPVKLDFSVKDIISGVASAEIIIDGKVYSLDERGTVSVMLDIAGKLGKHTATVKAKDTAGNTLDKTITFTAKTSINSIRKLIEEYSTAGKLGDAIVAQLTNDLKEMQHQQDIGRNDQAIKFANDFIKHLGNSGLQKIIDAGAKEILTTDANALIEEWTVK